MRKRIQKVINLSPKHLSVRDVLANTDGDQITGWLIVVLLVVVVGAFSLQHIKAQLQKFGAQSSIKSTRHLEFKERGEAP